MIHTELATLRPMSTAAGRKLLVGRADSVISPGDCLVLVKAGDEASDAYRLIRVSADPANPRDPLVLAAFLSPKQIDEAELHNALSTPTGGNGRTNRRHRGAGT